MTRTDRSHMQLFLEAYVPGDRRHALATGRPLRDRVTGAAVFADLAGFTPLTEALEHELGPQRGAEELTANLSRLFHALIEILERFGGHVIYFSGDAITGWFDSDDGTRATACALEMQTTMQEIGNVVSPAGSHGWLGLKAGVAAGAARRFVVGDPDIQLIDVLAGRLVDALAAAEQMAEPGEVVVDESALKALGARADVVGRRVEFPSERRFAVVAGLSDAPVYVPAEKVDGALAPDALRKWVLPAVFERLSTGHAEFLAELRHAYSIFVHFGGIDYDADDHAMAKLDAIVRHAQGVLTSYGGSLLQLTLGDKGGYFFGVLGVPLAHEDDAARAAAAALELRELDVCTSATTIQIGVAAGRVFSGTYGHRDRQAFSCMGDSVNLAARLMAEAPTGQIYVSALVRALAGEAFAWEELAPVKVKGKAEPVPVCALMGSKRHVMASPRTELPMIGRVKELDQLRQDLTGVLGGSGRVVGISAEAGLGKSRLVSEFLRIAEQNGVVTAIGECQSYGTNARYFVWQTVWSKLFGLDEASPDDDKVRALHAQLEAIDPGLVRRAPLLSALLDLPMPENRLTASMDAKVRKTSLESLLGECLRAMAARSPIVIALEDCHWLDSLSRDLAFILARSIASLRVMLVLAYRPDSAFWTGLSFETLPHCSEIALTELDNAQAAQLIRSKVEQIVGADAPPPDALIDLITARAQGNPFFIEELLSFIRSKSVGLQHESALRELELPTSLQSLLLSRIDTLTEAPRETLKVASVLGRAFRAAALPGVYHELGSSEEVKSHLQTLEASGLVKIDDEADEAYLFRHVVTQEVTYESLPFAFRAMLHERAGEYLEARAADASERQLDLLAHHYWHSQNRSKKLEYLSAAGDAAQASYANPAAIDYFERLLTLVEGSGRIDVLLKLGKVHELVGNWHRAEEVVLEALALAESLDDHARAASEVALAEIVRRQGRYDQSFELLNRAKRRFQLLADQAGVARVFHLLGTLAAQRGQYDEAVESYEASLRIRERAGDKASMASLLSNLGIVAEYRGDYDGSRAFHERALALRTEIGDRWAIGNSTNNLGMIASLQNRYSEARDWFQKSMQLSREVGDAWMVAIGHNNLGNATRGLGDYATARRHYAESLRAYRNYDDRWALAFLLEDIGVLAALDHDPRAALELIGMADGARDAIGAPRAPSLEEEIRKKLAPLVAGLSDKEQAECRARGRALDLVAAIERALAVCERAQKVPAA